jgi:leucyl aminopeptidase
VSIKITFADVTMPKGGTLVVGVLAGRALLATGQAVERLADGALSRAMKASRFKGERGQWLEIPQPQGLKADRVLLAGLGSADKVDLAVFESVGGEAARRVAAVGDKAIAFAVDAVPGARSLVAADAAAHLAYGARLGSYRFDKYHTKVKPEDKPVLDSVLVMGGDAAGARRAWRSLEAVAAGVEFTRNLVTEPANIIYPASLAAECRKLTRLGVKVEVLGEAQMKRLGMGALLGVGQGSVRESQLVVMRWTGGPRNSAPVAFIGKGVCFDTGGISIKPAGGMEEMKWDMAGAGAVIGTMMALAGRKAKVNAVGVVGLVENMPSGNAQRPGDVVTSMSGQTIEVLNTDAEGRLVLADAMWYTQERFKPKFMVDLATLTGAIIISLGHEHAGLFSNDDTLSERLTVAGKAEGEKLWRMPMGEAYDKTLKSPIADMQNIAGPGAGAGSITAAQFLQRFVNKVPWAHLDIAGTAWSKADKATVPKGATGFGVRLLDRLVRDHYEG